MKEWDMEDMESMEEWATETGPVIQEPVNTGNPHLDKAINKFYNCLSHIHEDPPTVQKVDNQTLQSQFRMNAKVKKPII